MYIISAKKRLSDKTDVSTNNNAFNIPFRNSVMHKVCALSARPSLYHIPRNDRIQHRLAH